MAATKIYSYSHGQKKFATEILVANGSTDIAIHAPNIDFQIVVAGTPGTVQILESLDDTNFEEILAATSTEQVFSYSGQGAFFRFTVVTFSSGSFTINSGWFNGLR